MMLIPAGVKVHLALGYTDLRKGIDGLGAMVERVLEQDPFSGHLFVFRGKRADLIKVLFWDGTERSAAIGAIRRPQLHRGDPVSDRARMGARRRDRQKACTHRMRMSCRPGSMVYRSVARLGAGGKPLIPAESDLSPRRKLGYRAEFHVHRRRRVHEGAELELAVTGVYAKDGNVVGVLIGNIKEGPRGIDVHAPRPLPAC